MTQSWIRDMAVLSALLLPLGCAGEPACDPESDEDGDGLDACAEEAAGTNPEERDSDGDGFDDDEEIACVSDPLDDREVCYECGWAHNDPGDLGEDPPVGPDRGDTIGNFELWDQCEEPVDLWDFAGEYHILYLTAAW